MRKAIVLPLLGLGLRGIALVGGKCASLGEMVSNLSDLGINVPPGFSVTAESYYQSLKSSELKNFIRAGRNN